MARKKKAASKRKAKPAAKKIGLKKTKLSAKKPIVKRKKSVTKRKAKVSAIPKGYHSITPYLIIDDAKAKTAISFYKSVFGAKQVFRMDKPDGKVGHAELKIGDAKIMLSDKCPEMEQMAGKDYGSGAISIHLYIKNVDAIIKKAVSGGAKIIMPVQDMFYGDRSGMVKDPFGHMWCVSTHIEDVTPAKMRKRAAEVFGKKK
jgi:PhnB protein